MTGKEAAKGSLDWLKRHRPGLAILAVGSSILAIAASSEQFHHAITWLGGGGVAGPLAAWIVEAVTQKVQRNAAPGIADTVAAKMEGKIDLLVDCHEKMAGAIVLLTAQQAETEKTRAEDHKENMGRVEDIHDRLDEHGEAINSLGEAMASLKQGWQMPPVKGREKK